MTPIEVHLSDLEINAAVGVGAARQVQAQVEGLNSRGGYLRPDQQWGVHMIGALGEMAAAKALGIYFDATVGTFKSRPDLEGIEVRTRSKHDWDLLVRKNDDPEAIFLHVTGLGPDFKVWGWAYGREAQQEKYIKNHGGRSPAFFMPSSDLHTVPELPT